jgi:hypothetical protein
VKLRPALVAAALALSALACAGGYEQALLTQFFAASRLDDRTALGPIATVMFDPRTDGTILRFDITHTSQEEHGVKRVTLVARVHLPSGDTVQKTLIVTMRRSDPAVDKGTTSTWIITSVTAQKRQA